MPSPDILLRRRHECVPRRRRRRCKLINITLRLTSVTMRLTSRKERADVTQMLRLWLRHVRRGRWERWRLLHVLIHDDVRWHECGDGWSQRLLMWLLLVRSCMLKQWHL